ncbi:MAG: ABC transporter ATP-binding protein [Deltaproteobacteria bacterium]|nr:ABC transporter ATP-binding protein [Deltaproteobacteria bacterium]
MDNRPQICLKVSRLSKRYGGQQVLRDISFSLQEGEILGIIGPNGAGKTTLFNIITGWVPPSGGEVVFLGEKITDWTPDRLCRAGMARTFQIPQVFPEMSVLENVMTGAWFGQQSRPSAAQAREQARELLGLVELAAKEATPARELTLMQQRLLELARALATRPKLLLLDEVAAGLSLKAVKCLSNLILRLRTQGLTLLLTDHLLHLIMPVSDRLLALDQGEIIAEGSPQDLIQNPEVESAYLGVRGAAGEEG